MCPNLRSGKPIRYLLAPLLQYHDDKVVTMLDPGRLGLHPATASGSRPDEPAMPSLTGRQQQALETLSRLARRHAIEMQTQPGDILLFNNYALLHARAAYQDGVGGDTDQNAQNSGPRRHLVRLWLRNPAHSWSIPDSMRVLWEPAYGSSIGRFLPRRYPVVPEREYKVPKYTSGSAAWAVEDTDEDDLS